jgi:hypothetical protein
METGCPHCFNKISIAKAERHIGTCMANQSLRQDMEDWFLEFENAVGGNPSSREYNEQSEKMGWPSRKDVLAFYGGGWKRIVNSIRSFSIPEEAERIKECSSFIKNFSTERIDGVSVPTLSLYKSSGGPHYSWILGFPYRRFVDVHMPDMKFPSGDMKHLESDNRDSPGRSEAFTRRESTFMEMPCIERVRIIWNWKTHRYEEVVSREMK